MNLFVAMIILFVLGYLLIALEHPIKINKSATSLLLACVLWVIMAVGGKAVLSDPAAFNQFLIDNPGSSYLDWLIHGQLVHALGETAEIIFFLLGAMTIVELIDTMGGFKVITDKLKTTKKVKLLWLICLLAFFMSAILDNMTTAIVMVALLRKLIADRKERWFFAGMVILAANAGGAWSPIGDVTTIMLWIKGQVTTVNIIVKTLLPSLVCMIVPLVILGSTLKGDIERPEESRSGIEVASWMRKLVLIMGVCGLIFVPVFKTITHLPPYLGMLLSLSVLWVTTEILSRRHSKEGHRLPTAVSTLEHVDVPTILFFLGILMAVSCLKVAGILGSLAMGLDSMRGIEAGGETVGFFLIDLIIGILSSIVDNVPLVAAVQGMYPMSPEGFIANHPFWEFLAYCAGTGGSLLIIGSAAGVAVMGMEKIDFIWYLKKISWLALVGYLAGAVVFIGMNLLLEPFEWWSTMV